LVDEFLSPIKWLNDHKESVQAFYEARMAIEPTCAKLAARSASPKQITELQINVEKSGRVARDEDILGFVALDIDFHSIIARISGNPHLYRALDLIINPETDARQVIHRIPGHLAVAQARHEKVFNAIAKKDEKAAKKMMHEAFTGLMKELKEIEV
jgi:DNA-binding FadR family transcriptional regulator